MAADAAIDIKIAHVAQIFDSFDPYPFRERDLDKDAEDYIYGFAQELPRRVPIRIIVHLAGDEAGWAEAAHLPEAIRRHFSYRADGAARDLRELFRAGRRALAVGLAVLALSGVVNRVLGTIVGLDWLQEGVAILGWVANWRPLEIFLYDWWPVARRRDLYRRLAAATVEVKPLGRRPETEDQPETSR